MEVSDGGFILVWFDSVMKWKKNKRSNDSKTARGFISSQWLSQHFSQTTKREYCVVWNNVILVQAAVPTFYILLFYIRSSTLLAGPSNTFKGNLRDERRDVLFQDSASKYNVGLTGISNYVSGRVWKFWGHSVLAIINTISSEVTLYLPL